MNLKELKIGESRVVKAYTISDTVKGIQIELDKQYSSSHLKVSFEDKDNTFLISGTKRFSQEALDYLDEEFIPAMKKKFKLKKMDIGYTV